MELQAKLLRAIQSNEITRVGGTKPIPLDIRLIASTNCNLKAKIAEGTFEAICITVFTLFRSMFHH